MAKIHGAKIKGSGRRRKQDKIKRPLGEVFGSMTDDVRGQSKLAVEWVKVSPEEMARRRKLK